MASTSTELKAPEAAHEAPSSTYDAPGWDIPEDGVPAKKRPHLHLGSASTRWAIADRFDHVFPPYKRYVGLRRRTFLLVLLAVILAVIALAVGLGVGLSNKHK